MFVPEEWSPDRQTAWKNLTPLQHLHRSTGRHPWVRDCVPVLPFSFEFNEEEKLYPRLSGTTEEPLTVYISPISYVGLTKDFRDVCYRTWRVSKRGDGVQVPTRASFSANERNWDVFKKWEVAGAAGIVGRLIEIYWDGSV